MRILIVEDAFHVANLLADSVRLQGHEAIVANSGEEALSLLAHRCPDAVFLDIVMPKMSGIDVLLRIRETYPALPVIVITGIASSQQIDEARRLGVTEVIEKPFVLKQLDEAMEKLGGRAEPIRVLIVASQGLYREGLCELLSRQEGIEIVGEIADGAQAMGVIDAVRPDVVLIDVGTPGSGGIELIRMIRRTGLDTQPLALCPAGDDAAVLNAVKAGANGYISTNATLAELRKAIQGLHRGEEWVERKLLLRFLGGDALAEGRVEETHERAKRVLTAREQEVLRSLTSGGTNKDIAQGLFISEKTVKTHLSNIFRKLNVTRRLQAVLYAVQHDQR